MLKLRQTATLSTRRAKEGLGLGDLTEEWATRATPYLDDEPMAWVHELGGQDVPTFTSDDFEDEILLDVANAALDIVSTKRPTFSRANVQAEVFRQMQGVRFTEPAVAERRLPGRTFKLSIDQSLAVEQITTSGRSLDNRIMVRTEAGNRPADYFRLISIFQESRMVGGTTDLLPRPVVVLHPAFSEELEADLIIRFVAASRISASGVRPLLGDDARDTFRSALRSSKLSQWLARMHSITSGPAGGVISWNEEGTNVSTRSELRYKGLHDNPLITPEARFVVELPRVNNPTSVQLTLDVIVRRPHSIADNEPNYIDISDIYYLFDSALETFAAQLWPALGEALSANVGNLIGPAVGVGMRPGLGATDVMQIRPPLRLQTGSADTLYGEMYPQPFLNPRNEAQRDTQSREWIRELLLDSRFLGVDAVVLAT